MLASGQTIAGRYVLVAPIGEGAMGAVWRAEDQTLKRPVAIKFLFVKGSRDPQAMVDQFLREARIAASVQHRNVIQTVDFGTFEQWQPFMVMELLSGESLGDRFARQPPLTREQVIHIVSLTLRGLAAVHDAGIVHRDLKPQNVFLQRDSEAVYPKILDFGISRTLEHKGERPSAIATQEGMIVGTPDYMSPEQARGEATIDKRSDIYSMAVILYEGLTGQLPFEAETVGDLIVQIVTQEPRLAREVRADVPQPLSELVAQAMSKNREHRFADARAMRRALLAAAESALPPGRRAAVSVPPPELESAGALFAPSPEPAPLALPPRPEQPAPGRSPARVAPDQSATWGDFEGLNAAQILDSEPLAIAPGPGGATPRAKPQRIVARASDHIAGGAPSPRAAERASAPRKSRKTGGELPAVAVALEDTLDPLYAGMGDDALDIDYERVSGPNRKSQAQVQPASNQQARGSRPRSKPRRPAVRPRVRFRLSLGTFLLPAAAIVIGWHAWTKPALETGRAGAYARARADARAEATFAAPGHGPQPAAVTPSVKSETEPAGAVPNARPSGASTSSSGLKQHRIQNESRRAEPGKAPPHLRDVVF